MDQKKKMKMCPFCDGQIDIDAFMCPFCGKDFSASPRQDLTNTTSQHSSSSLPKNSLQDTMASLYPPHYQPKTENTFSQTSSNSSYTPSSYNSFPKQEDSISEKALSKEEMQKDEYALLLPILFFSIGINLLLIGLTLFLFSSGGELFMKWNAKYWFIYIVLALPLSVLGYRGLNRVK